LDGLLPINLTPEGPQVPAGSLFARDPGGNVRYQNQTADALAQSGQSMNMAMQLLNDFNYNKLQIGVSYEPSGLSVLDLQFQGRNPDFFNGKPTHLNVNLEYNLLNLLESLRIADDIINRLEDKYQ
ncbi:MAG TPA: YdbH domain-containing protein, partial [Pseudomonadales bacterium]|nr:YdbH domain-containing protein [Pseudomonadales bacterium]